jgi:SAM-dependent methyltransferase
MTRRLTRRTIRQDGTPADVFHRHRQATAHRARLLNRVLVELGPGHTLDLPHAPDVSTAYHQAHDPDVRPHSPAACGRCRGLAGDTAGFPAAPVVSGQRYGSAGGHFGVPDLCHVRQQAHGPVSSHLGLLHAPDSSPACQPVPDPAGGDSRDPAGDHLVLPLPELLGMLGAHRWRIRGLRVPALGATIHPHYGVFAPTRQEYVDLVAGVPLPRVRTAFDIGTGTGVLAVLLAQRGAAQVIATDVEPRAVVCARDNVRRLGLGGRIRVEHQDLFSRGRADLIVCNPPWLPAEPTSPLEAAVYDPGGSMLRRLVHEVPHHLAPGGEAWLILSDLAERLGLRDEPTGMFAAAGLVVAGRHDVRPRHRTRRRGDPLSEHRAAEIVSLWRLRIR